jgi:hypothetical protein
MSRRLVARLGVDPHLMSDLILPAEGVLALCRGIQEIREETANAVLDGSLGVSADDLMPQAGQVDVWLTDITRLAMAAEGGVVVTPTLPNGELRHIVYTISAILVWADELRRDHRLMTTIPPLALSVWTEIEAYAGMPGRTVAALGHRPEDRENHTTKAPGRATPVPSPVRSEQGGRPCVEPDPFARYRC